MRYGSPLQSDGENCIGTMTLPPQIPVMNRAAKIPSIRSCTFRLPNKVTVDALVSLPKSSPSSSIISINQTFERNSLDNFISPNTGSKLGLSFEVAPPLPGLSEYYKIKTDYQYHIPIVEKLVLTSQVNFGFIGFFTNDRRSNFQRFLVGGTQLQQRQSFLS